MEAIEPGEGFFITFFFCTELKGRENVEGCE